MSEVTEYIDSAQQSAAELADRYVALWNEADPERRRTLIAGLWGEQGEHILQPSEEARRIAAGPGVGGSAIIEVRGHAEIEARATSAYERWVASQGWRFRRRDDADRVHDTVKFHWEAVAEDGEVTGSGLNLLVVAPDGRIERDYTFVDG
jgi:V8-like Glu-specific endopeptidase